jgi:hypothetical protein
LQAQEVADIIKDIESNDCLDAVNLILRVREEGGEGGRGMKEKEGRREGEGREVADKIKDIESNDCLDAVNLILRVREEGGKGVMQE